MPSLVGSEMCIRDRPWDTPREMDEEALETHLRGLVSQIKNQDTAIYNFHVPPYGYSLDLCPKLDENLTMAAEEKIHVGSIGAKKLIEENQPLLGLFGHIHELSLIHISEPTRLGMISY